MLQKLIFALAAAALPMAATPGGGGTINYNTTGSTLSCSGVPGCVQNTSTSVSIGGLTMTYNAGSGSNVAVPSIINLGNLVTTGTGSAVTVSGLMLTINVNSTPPGASGALPGGLISGTVSTNSSQMSIAFTPNNTTSAFGTLPGKSVSGGNTSFLYQVLNPSLGLQAPTIGNPVGQTSIQGAVTNTSGAASVKFVAQNTATQGNWKGAGFASDGEIVAQDSTTYPSYAAPVFSGAQLFTWAFTGDQRALQQLNGPGRIASAYYANSFSMDLSITDGGTHSVTMYFMDWDGGGRAETITFTDAITQQVLSTQSISNFTGGLYLIYDVSGHVTVTFTKTAGANALLNGVFFGPELQ